MDTTTNLQLPYLFASQAQKHVIHNEALRALDAVIQLSVISRSVAIPPSSPADGDRYLVATGAGDAWTGRQDQVAIWQDGAWAFHTPHAGWRAWSVAEAALIVFDGSAWALLSSSGINSAALVGVNATADTTNRLAVSSPATLLNHEGSSHQLKINKALTSDTASLLFQTGFSGRAEFGTTGDDEFHVKVSADGNSWNEAIVIDGTTGEVTFPNTVLSGGGGGGGGSNPNLLINGDFSINQRAFAGGALTAGNYGHDRWRAATGGANYTVAGIGDAAVITLTSGKLEQVIEPAVFGYGNLASTQITVSVDDPSQDVQVEVGSASGTITAGSGTRSVTITTGAGDTGNIALTLDRLAAGSVTFGRVKMEVAAAATAWQSRAGTVESALCSAYFERIDFPANASVAVVTAATSTNWNGVFGFSRKRAVPTISHNGAGLFNLLGLSGETILSAAFAPTVVFSSIAGAISGATMGVANSYTVQGLAGLKIDIDAEI